MDFSLTSDQRMMQESLTRTLAEASSLDRVRKFAGDLTDKGGDIWKAMIDFGLAGLVAPQVHGWHLLAVLDADPAAKASGAGARLAPFVRLVLVAALLLVRRSP